MAPSRVAGGLVHSSSSSGIYFQGDEQSQGVGNSHWSSSFGNSSNSIPGLSNLDPASGDASNSVLNSAGSSDPSVGASSLVTDANSGLSGGPHLQRSASITTDSYMRLPASPMSFSSNSISISGSSVIDCSPVVQQSSNQDPSSQELFQNQQQQGASSATSLPTSQMGPVSLPTGPRVPGSFVPDPDPITKLQKKPRLNNNQEAIMQQQFLQQLLQRQDSMQLQNHNPQLQALIHQQRLRQQQQQFLQSIPPVQRAQLLQQQQLRQQFQQQGVQPISSIKRPHDNAICSRRLKQYLYHQRQKPSENAILYWRKFVAEYYSPHAKKRWCLSSYSNVGHHSLGVFPRSTVDAWQCDICGSKSGRGFEATFEILPRLNEIKFASGVIDELMFLDLPREFRFPSGLMVLEYGKAVQESVYEQIRVVHEGQLRIVFAPDLKILSWDFCACRHEELLPRRLVAPQVNQLLQLAQKCQSTISERGSDGVSQQDLQANSNMVVMAGHQLARTLELQSLNDLGFSKRYVRCLQVSEVVNSMKDLIDFCSEQKVGAIDGLKIYPRHTSAAKPLMQDMEQLATTQGLPTDRNTVNKLMAMDSGVNNQMSSNHQTVGGGALSGSVHAAMALTTYQNLLMRQNSMNSNTSSLQQDAPSSFNNSPQNPISTFQGSPMQNVPVNGLSNSQLPQQQQQRLFPQRSHSQPAQGSQAMQQQMIQQLLHSMNNNTGKNASGNVPRDGSAGYGSNASETRAASMNVAASSAMVPSRTNSFKAAASNSDSSSAAAAAGGGGNNSFNPKALPDLGPKLYFPEEMMQDIAQEFTEKGLFTSDVDDSMGFGWKA